MKMKPPVIECADPKQRAFFARVLSPVVDLVNGTAALHEKMFLGGGIRVLLEIKSGVPESPGGVLTSLSPTPANQERQLVRLDMSSEDSKNTGATAMMQLLEYVPDVVVSGDITGEQLYQAILRRVNYNAGALLPDAVRLGEIRKLKSVKHELSEEDGDLVVRKWKFRTNQMCEKGAIRIPFMRVVLSSEPNRDVKFSDELRIACGGGSPDVNMIMSLKIFRILQASLRQALTNAAFTFDVKELFEQSPEAMFWRQELSIPFY